MAKRQLSMVIDLNKCIGCQTCTIACKTQWTNRNGREYMLWNNVEKYPSQGYPKNWQKSGGGFDATGDILAGIIPDEKDYGLLWDCNHIEDEVSKDASSDNYFFYIPRICNHCTNPACLSACPRDAIFKRDEDGVVLVDLDRCQGYRYCIAGCPYKKVYFNPKISKSEKCNLCFPRIEKGLPPACAQQCAGRARFVGFLDDAQSQVYKLIYKYKVALPLLPHSGTQSNVYYVPPASSPPKFDAEGRLIEGSGMMAVQELEKLFGPEVYSAIKIVKEEMQKRKETGKSELMDLLIAYQHKDMFRLDGNYYQQVAKEKGIIPPALVDERYLDGKYS